MAAVVDKTFYSPYTITHTAIMASASTGIFDSIQVTSDDSTDKITVEVTPLGDDAGAIKVASGESVYGPFTSYKITAIDSDVTVIIQQRSKSIDN